MRIAVAGSIATDHLLTFDGRFSESVLPDQLSNLSLSFLASDLQVRRGGTGANIAFGLGVLGLSPLLVGSVGKDAADYLDWLADNGVDLAAVNVSPTLSTARFTCTTDRDHCQIATFYPGAMGEAAQIDIAALFDLTAPVDATAPVDLTAPVDATAQVDGASRTQGGPDLFVVAPDDPAAMARHTATCRDRGIPFAADPSQQLAFLDGPAIRHLVDGATYLFTNDYEAGLVREKTGWTEDEILARVGTRVTTRGADGIHLARAGRPEVEVGVVPARRLVEPTGVGDAFRAGFLAATAWGLGLERSAQVGALLATCVVESVGTQEYAFEAEEFAARLARTYGQDAAEQVRPHLPG